MKKKPPRFIYITGCDGTGKTTQARLLMEQLRRQGVKVRHLWLRFPFFFSAPFLAFARWRGYSWSEVHGSIRHGYWDFRRSWLMRTVFPWVLLLDASIAAALKVYLPLRLGWTIVCERFALDILVDLEVAIRRIYFWDYAPGRNFLRLIPSGSKIFILDLDLESICKRRSGLRFDKALEYRLTTFQRLSKALQIEQVQSTLPVEEINQLIWKGLFLSRM